MTKRSNKSVQSAKEVVSQEVLVENVASQDLEIRNNPETAEEAALRLDKVAENLSKELDTPIVFDAANREFLEMNGVKEYLSPEVTSSKYDKEREVRVQQGLEVLGSLSSDFKINPLLLLLGKWWENKLARSQVKKMIDVEANEKGYNSETYLQIILNKDIEKLSEIQTAIDRLRYAKTYFKPRQAVKMVVPTKKLKIDEVIYLFVQSELDQAKIDYPNKEDLIKFLKTIGTVEEIESI